MNAPLITQLARHVVQTPYSTFTPAHLEAVKMRLVDAVSCGLSGARVEGNEGFIDLFSQWGGTPEASVWVGGEKLPMAQAAAINSLQVRSFDFEVGGPEPEGVNAGKMVGHVASTIDPVALAVGEHLGSTGEEIAAALILGGDVAARISVANKFDFDKNFEVCGTSNAFGAVAVTARLMKLDVATTQNAFGILLNLMAGSFQGIWDGVHSFKLPGAMAAFNGIFACQLAQRGFGGVKDALESRMGYFTMYTQESSKESLVADLGEVFYVHGQHKLHPSCYGNHNPIEAALQLRQEHEFSAREIVSVELDVPPNRVDHFLNQAPTVDDEQPKSLFTIPYGVANALLRGHPELEHYVAPAIYDADVLELAARVRLVPNLPLGNNQASRLRVTLEDGRVLEAERSVPKGWLENQVPFSAIEEKYWRNVAFARAIPTAQAQAALDAFRDLENLDSITPVVRLLVAPSV